MKRKLFRCIAYAVLIILLYVLQDTPYLLPEIFGGKPMLLSAFAFTVATKEKRIPSLIIGAVCGILTDASLNGNVGFFAIALTLLCYFEAYFFETFFASSFGSAMIASSAATVIVICLYFLLTLLFNSVADWGALFVSRYISRIIYTILTEIPLYFLISFLYEKH